MTETLTKEDQFGVYLKNHARRGNSDRKWLYFLNNRRLFTPFLIEEGKRPFYVCKSQVRNERRGLCSPKEHTDNYNHHGRKSYYRSSHHSNDNIVGLYFLTKG